MEKRIKVLIIILFVLTILFPVGSILCGFIGYDFILFNIPIFSAILAALAVYVAVLTEKYREFFENNKLKILMTLFLPFSFINLAFCTWESRYIYVCVCHWIVVICGFILCGKFGKPKGLKTTSIIISSIAILPMLLISLFIIIGGYFVKTTVVRTVDSPNSKYYVEVSAIDEGTFGGDTVVDVHKKRGLNLLLFKIKKKPQRVYIGEWDEFETINIVWEDENCLRVRSSRFEFK